MRSPTRALTLLALVLAGCDQNNIVLSFNQWVCTKTAEEKTEQLVMVGNILVPMTDKKTVCVTYERRRAK